MFTSISFLYSLLLPLKVDSEGRSNIMGRTRRIRLTWGFALWFLASPFTFVGSVCSQVNQERIPALWNPQPCGNQRRLCVRVLSPQRPHTSIWPALNLGDKETNIDRNGLTCAQSFKWEAGLWETGSVCLPPHSTASWTNIPCRLFTTEAEKGD